MESKKLIEIAEDVENKSNNDLMPAANELYEEFESTKQLIVDLTRHLDGVESLYNKVNKEIKKRIEGK
jgi:hypothetical protein